MSGTNTTPPAGAAAAAGAAAPTTILGGKPPETTDNKGTNTTTDKVPAKAGEMAAAAAGDAGTKEPAQKEGEAGAAADDKAKADKVAAGDIELKLPEGVEADAELLEGFKGWAKEQGLTGEAAQKFLDTYVKHQGALQAKQREQEEVQIKEWETAIQKDQEIGGKGHKESMAAARAAVAKYSTPELGDFLERTGLGSHPEVVRLFVRVGKALAEDSVAGTSGPEEKTTPTEEDIHRLLYPSMNKD